MSGQNDHEIDLLVKALRRGSPMHADALGLPFTADDLLLIRERVVLAWFLDRLSDSATPTAQQVIDFLTREAGATG